MNRYIIQIPNEREKIYSRITFIILSLQFFAFGYVLLMSPTILSSGLALSGLILNAVPWLYYLLNKKNAGAKILATSGIISAFIWMYFGNYFPGTMLLLFTLAGIFAGQKKVIIFTDTFIEFPSFPPRKYFWNQIEKVVYKDDILTIDLKNNQLIQVNVTGQFATQAEAEQFNEWCTEKLLQKEIIPGRG